MQKYNKKLYRIMITVFLLLALPGCAEARTAKSKADLAEGEISTPIKLDTTIGSLAEFVSLQPIPVRGIGLVVGLPGTGSTECPPAVRKYLSQYIMSQLGRRENISPNKMIDNRDTAVVHVESIIAPGTLKRDKFDVFVKALDSTQTTSLQGGRLYTTELKFIGRVEESYSASKTLALAAGPVYIDTLNGSADQRSGTVIGGGRSIENHQLMLSLFDPDFRVAAQIRDRINERFGKGIANAVSQNVIYISVPKKYEDYRQRFLELIYSLFIAQSQASQSQQIDTLVSSMLADPANTKYTTSLEAIGKSAARKLRPLLNSGDEIVQFNAARCLLSMDINDGLSLLRGIAHNSASPLRAEAVRAIGDFASKREVVALMNRMVRGDDFAVRHIAYKYLRKYNASSIVRTSVSRDFYLDRVIQIGQKVIYVSRKEELSIVLFGAPIECARDIYIESDDGSIIINALPDAKSLSIMRKHPFTGTLMGPLKSNFRVADIVRVLGSQPSRDDARQKGTIGLGAPYSDIIAILKKMCDSGAVEATFVPGDM